MVVKVDLHGGGFAVQGAVRGFACAVDGSAALRRAACVARRGSGCGALPWKAAAAACAPAEARLAG